MRTPISDFLLEYSASGISRLHMPGHKGNAFTGAEPKDITEIKGADVLHSAEGIIAESEGIATELFGTGKTVYSTEGSTLAIRTMLFLVARNSGEKPLVIAGRNAHKSFLYSAALLDFDIKWLFPEGDYSSLATMSITPGAVERAVISSDRKPSAVYLTSPDYMGNILDVEGIARALAPYGIPLLVDNAHGAYLHFLDEPRHPMDLGAFMCSDSAHKTLPVLTGGAYLHMSKEAAELYGDEVKRAMSVFASTSPSYVILDSLDLCNNYISSGYSEKLNSSVKRLNEIRTFAKNKGIKLIDGEPLKLVIDASAIGYSGDTLAQIMREHLVEPEYSDPDYLVLMAGTENSERDYERIAAALSKVTPKAEKPKLSLESLRSVKSKMSVREAIFAKSERLRVDKAAVGRTVSTPTVSCPPAIPIVSAGEVLTDEVLPIFEKYGIYEIDLVKE